MTKKIQRKKLKKQLAAFFIKQGKFYNSTEYTALGNSMPIPGSSIRRIYGRYAGLEAELRADETLVALVEQSAALQAPVKPVTAPAPKVKPVTKAKPASKFGASTVEK